MQHNGSKSAVQAFTTGFKQMMFPYTGVPGPKNPTSSTRRPCVFMSRNTPIRHRPSGHVTLGVSPRCIWYNLRALKITRKKNDSLHSVIQCDPKQRREYLSLRERYRRQGKHFVYVDESGFEPNATRRYGYARKGRRVFGGISGQKRPRTSFLAARMPEGTLSATQLWEGTCNTEIFNDWCKRVLCAQLNDKSVIVMDNAAFHKSETTRKLIEAKGAKLLFLPPYSPDLNPIEHDFSALKKIREYNHEKSIDEIIRTYK